ncbi:MAG TPA: T9SS type A sorting domain-containing protein [Niastella sp.]|nr:T9SS type A sorting domain-containing protein [Niastella sp.]
MKKILLASTFCLGIFASKATVHTVMSTSSFTFTPPTVNANVGDTVVFILTSPHTATEVSFSTWTAGGSTPLSGGFNFNSSSPLPAVKMTAPGTRYFVCQPHASMGMKGQINVTGGSNVVEQNTGFLMSLYPNPATDLINLNISGAENEVVSISVVNLLGSKVIDLGGKQTLSNGVKHIDISALPKGVYFLNIVSDNKNKSFRFVKQ